MTLSAFPNKGRHPNDDDLHSVLGNSHAAWKRLIELVSGRVSPLAEVWGYSSASTGWGLRLKYKERVILYMTPRENHFLVSFALGAKAVAAAHAAKLPASVLKAIDSAPQYAEGRGVRIKVRTPREVTALARLAQIKHEH